MLYEQLHHVLVSGTSTIKHLCPGYQFHPLGIYMEESGMLITPISLMVLHRRPHCRRNQSITTWGVCAIKESVSGNRRCSLRPRKCPQYAIIATSRVRDGLFHGDIDWLR